MGLKQALIVLALGWGSSAAKAQEPSTPPTAVYHSAIAPEDRRVFFGEMHLHTTISLDAWIFGTKVTPDQAYRFGRGETIMVPAVQLLEQGIRTSQDVAARRAWPLDFMAVTDHAEWMGVMHQLDDPASPVRTSQFGQTLLKNPPHTALPVLMALKNGGPTAADLRPVEAARQAWDLEMKAANDNYRPGKFTTFIAYEWSAFADNRYNLHRNVFFNSDHAPLPFGAVDTTAPEDLWTYLEKVRASGVDVMAIPHNGNASNGLMYDWNDSGGRPIDQAYAMRRAANEPLTEIVQSKGQSDTTPSLSPQDEFANFEIYDHLLAFADIKSKPDGSYVRQALGRGLVIQNRIGANPFKYGLVGASDFHNGLSASDENAFAPDIAGADPKTMTPTGDTAKRMLGFLKTEGAANREANLKAPAQAPQNPLQFSGAGITGVWAEENNRNSIFAALKRKETFATSGTRIRVRLFAGWGFDPSMIRSPDWVRRAYASGVPMGGDLPSARPAGGALRFIVQATKDPDGANLDRIQIIKVWLLGDQYQEKIFDVALSGGRRPDPRTGQAGAVGNTVDLKTGRFQNTIGASELRAMWTDPAFDPKAPALYYARVLEIPTARWSTLLAIANKLPAPAGAAATIQERAWSSPIWFTPAKELAGRASRRSVFGLARPSEPKTGG